MPSATGLRGGTGPAYPAQGRLPGAGFPPTAAAPGQWSAVAPPSPPARAPTTRPPAPPPEAPPPRPAPGATANERAAPHPGSRPAATSRAHTAMAEVSERAGGTGVRPARAPALPAVSARDVAAGEAGPAPRRGS